MCMGIVISYGVYVWLWLFVVVHLYGNGYKMWCVYAGIVLSYGICV